MTENISDRVQIQRVNGSVQRGGWQCSFTSMRDTDVVEENQRVMVTWRPALGGPPGVLRTAFDGHTIPSRVEFDRTGSKAAFTAETSDGYLRNGWCQGIGFADMAAVARAHYHQFDSVTGGAGAQRMTLGRVVRHLLGYYDSLGPPPATCPDWVAHTNLVYHPTENPHGWVDLANVETTPWSAGYTAGTMRVDRFIVRETENLWSKLQEIAASEFFVIYFDKSNTLYYKRHPMYGTLPPAVMTFDAEFCLAPPVVEPRESNQVRQVLLASVTDAGATLHAEYPTSPTYVYGKVEELSRLRCNDQAALDYWAQRHYLYLNRDFSVRWTVPGLAGLLFDLLDRVQITYSGTAANGVHYEWEEKKFWVHEIDVIPDNANSGTSTFLLESESM